MNKSQLVELYEDIMQDDKSQKIEYSISEGYVPDLTPVFGIKEFMANFLDANGEDFEMSYDNKSLILADKNDGINLKYMIIGNSGSREDLNKIGEHGEGFKIGALTLVREGHKVLFHTVGYSIAFGMEYNPILKANVMYAKYRENNISKGTIVFLECTKKDYDKAKSMFLYLTDYIPLNDNIYIPTHKRKTKEIYLNGLLHTNKTSLFAYNFKQKGLVSNRDRNFIKQSVIEENLIDIYQNIFDSEVINHIVDAMLDVNKDFHRYIESSIINQLQLTVEQQDMYYNSIPSDYHFTNNKDRLHDIVLDKYTVIEVDDSLLQFLEYIGANILTSKHQEEDNGSELKSFTIPIDKLPKLDELEIGLMKQILNNPIHSFNKKTSTLIMKISDDIQFSAEEFKSYLRKFNLSWKVYQNVNRNDKLKAILNNLILLSCYENIETKLKFEDTIFKIKVELKENYQVEIVSEQETDLPTNSIAIKKPLPFDEMFGDEKEKFLYFYSLKYKPITSVYSYVLMPNRVFDGDKDEVNSILLGLLRKKRKASTFLTKLMEYREITNLYESEILTYYIPDDIASYVQEWFSKKYSKHSISYTEEFDKMLINNYGYTIIKCSPSVNRILNVCFKIKNSKEQFDEEQKNRIMTVDNNEIMEQALKLFKEIHPKAKVNIYSAYELPTRILSATQNGNIYISQSIKYPEYMTALMNYEYEKLRNNATSPSQLLQSILTHEILDEIL